MDRRRRAAAIVKLDRKLEMITGACRDGAALFLTTVDDGLGFLDKPRSGGLGLRLMRNVAELTNTTPDGSEKWRE